jgi:hypothetical protein
VANADRHGEAYTQTTGAKYIIFLQIRCFCAVYATHLAYLPVSVTRGSSSSKGKQEASRQPKAKTGETASPAQS